MGKKSYAEQQLALVPSMAQLGAAATRMAREPGLSSYGVKHVVKRMNDREEGEGTQRAEGSGTWAREGRDNLAALGVRLSAIHGSGSE